MLTVKKLEANWYFYILLIFIMAEEQIGVKLAFLQVAAQSEKLHTQSVS